MGAIERDRAFRSGLRIIRIKVKQASPTSPYPNNLLAFPISSIHYRFDTRIETRDVTTAR
jgi:hypothetical protein